MQTGDLACGYGSVGRFVVRLQNPIRRACIALIERKWWDRAVLGLILLNTIALALYDPFDTVESRPTSVRRDVLEWISKVRLAAHHTPADTPIFLSLSRVPLGCELSVTELHVPRFFRSLPSFSQWRPLSKLWPSG
eukprot:1464486-Rhodomonas_salina.1